MTDQPIDLPLPAITALCKRFPIRKLALFGSVLREDFGPNSDIDVLVEFDEDARVGYFELADIQIALEEILGRKVDLLTPGALSPYFKQQVIDTAQVMYERK